MTSPTADHAGTHPRGLYTLFFTEMWERFSYYGMRALLVLFLIDTTRGGMGFDDKTATAIYGLYTAAVYLAALPGGWVADRILGARRSVWWGGIIIAAGHFTLALPGTRTFFLGLLLIVAGTGLLKPNISAMVGELYPEGGARRDAGFTVFYMGINLGATLGPLACSTLGEKLNWHYGFAAAGCGMVLGLVQFKLSARHLGEVGLRGINAPTLGPKSRLGFAGSLLAAIIVASLAFAGIVPLNPLALAKGASAVILGIGAVYFAYAFLLAGLDSAEKKRLGVILLLFVSSALFWAGFEQVGSSFNIFAERHTDRTLTSLGFVIPTGWFQSLGPIFIVSLAPVMAALWVALGRRNANPGLSAKFGYGLVLLAAGLMVMALASYFVSTGTKVLPWWLVTTYLLHTIGELCLSPVGLSSVTKLAPKRLVGQMMGVWFLATSLGNLLAGLLAGALTPSANGGMSGQFLAIAIPPLLAGLLMIVLSGKVRKWSAGCE